VTHVPKEKEESRMIKRVQPNAVPESDAPFSPIVLDDRYAYLAGLVAADWNKFGRGRLDWYSSDWC